MAKREQTQPESDNTTLNEGELTEHNDSLWFKCNRPLSFTEHMNLVAKIQVEEERIGRRIIIIPHAVDVVKS